MMLKAYEILSFRACLVLGFEMLIEPIRSHASSRRTFKHSAEVLLRSTRYTDAKP